MRFSRWTTLLIFLTTAVLAAESGPDDQWWKQLSAPESSESYNLNLTHVKVALAKFDKDSDKFFSVEKVGTEWKLGLNETWLRWYNALPQEHQSHVVKALIAPTIEKRSTHNFRMFLSRDNGEFLMELYMDLRGNSVADYLSITDTPEAYNEWLFNDINSMATGDEYFVKLHPLTRVQGPPPKPGTLGRCSDLTKKLKTVTYNAGFPFTMRLPYDFRFLTYHKATEAEMVVTCGPQTPKGWYEWSLKVRPGPVLAWAVTRIIFFSADDRHVVGTTISRARATPMIYQMLPLNLIRRQMDSRVATVFGNFEDYFSTVRKNSVPVNVLPTPAPTSAPPTRPAITPPAAKK